jgi:heterodisulfide reductase subunit A
MPKEVIGSVMVVGGGISGMQAALDLADSGYYVYLAEKGSSIGGVMAQLDKTFPTNDCAMWIISPKLVEGGKLLVRVVDHIIGRLSVCPYSAPSFAEDGPLTGRAQVNPVLCKGCGLCVASCRFGAIHLKGFDNDQIFAQIFALNKAVW